MESYFVKQWDANKHLLEARFKDTCCPEAYEEIFKLVLEIAVPEANQYDKWWIDGMVVIDHGSYSGTQIFIVPCSLSPMVSEYMWIDNDYGSCSGCDTLCGIISDNEWDEDCSKMLHATESQVKDLMTLSLHMVQRMKWLTKD